MVARSNRREDEQSTQQQDTTALSRQSGLSDSAPPIAGSSDGVLQSENDVETLRQRAQMSEARYRAMIDSALDPIIGMDEHGRITEFNRAAERVFGYTRADVVGQVLAEVIIPPRFRHQHARGLARYLATGDSQILGRRLRLSGLRSDGVEFPVELAVVRLPDEDGAHPCFMASLRDLTDLRHEEAERTSALSEAEAARLAAAHQAAELAATFEAMSDGVLVYDLDARIIHSNSAIETLLGFDKAPEIVNLPFAERILRVHLRDGAGNTLASEDSPIARALRGEDLTGTEAIDLLIRALHGREIAVSCSVAPLRDAHGAITGAVAVFHDVTERRELERDLSARASELEAVNARLRTMLHVLPVGVFIADANGAFTEVNAMGRAIWGQDAPMLTSLAEYGTYVGWWPDTGEQIKPEEWALARALTTGELVIGEEIRIQAFDGQIRTALNSTAPIYDANGTIVGGVVTLMDITERERLTERTRQALDGFIEITQSLVGAPADGDEQAAASQRAIARRLAELTRNVLACGRVAISVVEGEGEERTVRAMTVVGLEPEQEQEWRRTQASRPEQRLSAALPANVIARLVAGEPVTLDVTQSPYNTLPNPYGLTSALIVPMMIHGRLVGVIVLDYVAGAEEGRNAPHRFTREEIQLAEASARLGAVVLDRERLLGEREAARARSLALEEANRRMDEFIGIAGHELRTPLTSVKANIQLAERRARALSQTLEDGSNANVKATRLTHLLTNAVHGVERQERLVGDLLDISRISSGKLRYRMAPCDLSALAREIAQELLLTTTERVVHLDIADEPVMTLADSDRVGQVLTNYLTNALKYAPSDRPITVRLRSEGLMARVEVIDEGPGLSEEQQRGLFERFYRAEGIEPQSGSGVGLGLGLYISRMIVERHGGQVGIESAPGQGATFWFTMPLLVS